MEIKTAKLYLTRRICRLPIFYRLTARAALLLFCTSVLCLMGLSTEATPNQSGAANLQRRCQTAPHPSQSGKKTSPVVLIKRADFEVAGTSCVTCIRHLSASLRHTKGVLNADVSIFPPHQAIVIYDAGKTSLPAIWACIARQAIFKRVSFQHLEESALPALPAVIVPRR